MNPTPTISEAARRAAERILIPHSVELPTFTDDDEEHAWRVEQVAKEIQSALDSAHPAPKEGETPETDAEFSAHPIYYRSSAGNHFPVVQLVFARSLELRLSEAKREITQLKNNDTNLTDMLNDLRSQLKTANELLGDLVGWAETIEVVHAHPFMTNAPIVAARTHLNQQSK